MVPRKVRRSRVLGCRLWGSGCRAGITIHCHTHNQNEINKTEWHTKLSNTFSTNMQLRHARNSRSRTSSEQLLTKTAITLTVQATLDILSTTRAVYLKAIVSKFEGTLKRTLLGPPVTGSVLWV